VVARLQGDAAHAARAVPGQGQRLPRLQAGQRRPYNRALKSAKRHVGVWHETYVVPAGSYEAIYVDMPAFGLAAATGVIPVGRRGESAEARLARDAG
jgi:hypothetical protein